MKAIKKLAKNVYKILFYKIIYPLIYKKHARNNIIKNQVSFIETRETKLSGNFFLLRDMLGERGFQIKIHCLGQNSLSIGAFGRRSREMIKELAVSPFAVISDGSPVVGCLPIKKETKIAGIWHACGAFKRFGFDADGGKFGGKNKDLIRYKNYSNVSFVSVSSEEVVPVYARSMGLPQEKILPLGVSRTDAYFDNERLKSAKKKLGKAIPQSSGKKLILYAPTFRGVSLSAASAPNFLDIMLFHELLGEEYFLLIKHHPAVKKPPGIPVGCENFAVYCPQEITIDDALMAADILVTDYSSVIFEYSLLGRPMFFLTPDIDDYIDERGFYYPFSEFIPGSSASTTKELAETILSQSFDPAIIEKFRKKFMSACDGQATARICDELTK